MDFHQGMLTLTLVVVLTLHMRPTTATACSTNPCHTLSEYAQDSGQYFNNSNLTLLFLPGNHTLDVNLTITSIYQLEIVGNSVAVAQTKVVCSSRVGIIFSNIHRVRIEGLAFVSCARAAVVQDDYFTTYYGLHFQSIQFAEIVDLHLPGQLWQFTWDSE